MKYCGCRIEVNDDGSIHVDQNEYVEAIKHISDVEGPIDRTLNEKEKK